MSSLIKIIGDPGSCHLGDYDQAIRLIDVGKQAGIDAVKFQMFPKEKAGDNIYMPYEWFPSLKKYGDKNGIEVFASVWDMRGLEILHSSGCKSIKFAYSMRNEMDLIDTAMEIFETVYVSGPLLHNWKAGCVRLFCVPEYPLIYDVNFHNVFPFLADGFSDHSLDNDNSIMAVRNGATVVERHFQLDEKANCPDGKFALTPLRLKQIVVLTMLVSDVQRAKEGL